MINLKPYDGKDSYIFVSYAHKDEQTVKPLIQKLMNMRYRIWYDEGIDPGTEWDENIAKHIEKSEYMIAFISNNYLNSNNCKDELNYARDLDKQRLIVYLENTDLPGGMKMRLNRLQSIFKYKYEQEADFYNKLYSADKLEICKDKNLKQSTNTQSLQEKDFILKNRTDLRIENHTIPEMCSYFDEYIPTGNFEFVGVEERKNYRNTDPDKDVFLGFSFEIVFSNQAKDSDAQLYIIFEKFAQIFNDDHWLTFLSPQNPLPLDMKNQGTYSLNLNFVCRKLINDNDMLEDVIESFKRESPQILLNVVASNGFVDERFEISGVLNFSDKNKKECVTKSDVHYTISEYDFSKSNID